MSMCIPMKPMSLQTKPQHSCFLVTVTYMFFCSVGALVLINIYIYWCIGK